MKIQMLCATLWVMIAGKVQRKIEVSSRLNKAQQLCCVEGLLGDDDNTLSAD